MLQTVLCEFPISSHTMLSRCVCKVEIFKKNYFIILLILFLAALGLRCCTWASSSCGEQGLLFIAVRGLLIAVASLVAEHEL